MNLKVTPYQEALSYMVNAKETLIKAGIKDYQYKEIKFVQSASGIAYNAFLLAINELLKREEGINYKTPLSIDEYRKRISKIDKNLLEQINFIYDSIHLIGYFHGTQSVKTISKGFEDIYKVIEKIK